MRAAGYGYGHMGSIQLINISLLINLICAYMLVAYMHGAYMQSRDTRARARAVFVREGLRKYF